MNKRLEKIVAKLQAGERASVRRDQVKKAIEEGGFDYFIHRGYDEVYSVEPQQLAATIDNIEPYWLNNGDMWAKLYTDKNMLEITIKYGYSYMELWVSVEDKKETKEILHKEEVMEQAPVTTEGITVEFNEAKNGIEITFASKELATVEIREQIKAVGFRWFSSYGKWMARQNKETIELVNRLFLNNSSESEAATTEEEIEVLPDANDFNNIETLKDKYITNWDSIPEELQNFILDCEKYWIDLQWINLYKDNKIVASMSISRWGIDITVNSIGAGELFQWEASKGYTINNMVVDAEIKEWEEASNKYKLINFDDAEITEVENKDIFVNCLVPSLNKNCNKQLNDEEIKACSYLNKFKVQR